MPFGAMQAVGHTVWAVGTGGIWASPDDGRHWAQRYAEASDFHDVDFVDGGHGWAVGSRQVLATTDAGLTWTPLSEPHCAWIRTVHFVTPTHGYAVSVEGSLLQSADGGDSWRPLAAPPGTQSVCFQDGAIGWIGTAHHIFASTDGGASWTRIVRYPGGWRHARATVELQCAGGGVAWALAVGMGAASSQSPHLGWRLTTTGGSPLFAEQYFPHPQVHVRASSPGSYPGPFSAISPVAAAFVDNCPACGLGASPWLIAHNPSRGLERRGRVADLTLAVAGAFVSPTTGCVTGQLNTWSHGHIGAMLARIVCTYDAGAHWAITWERQLPKR